MENSKKYFVAVSGELYGDIIAAVAKAEDRGSTSENRKQIWRYGLDSEIRTSKIEFPI